MPTLTYEEENPVGGEPTSPSVMEALLKLPIESPAEVDIGNKKQNNNNQNDPHEPAIASLQILTEAATDETPFTLSGSDSVDHINGK
jgi:hypothetical protein